MSVDSGSVGLSAGRGTVILASTVDMSNLFYDGIVQELATRQWAVHVVSGPGGIGVRLFGEQARIHELPMMRAVSPVRDVRALMRWMRLLMRIRPSVLVVGTPKASLLGGIAGRAMRTPQIVYIVHGLRAERTRGLVGRAMVAAERVALRSAHRIVAVSPSLRREIERAHPRFRGRVDVLGHGSLNGVDLQRFVPPHGDDDDAGRRRATSPVSSFVIGFVGRLHRDKGGQFLLRLMRDERIASRGVRLLVVGEIEDDVLRSDAEGLVADGLMTVTGWIDAPEMRMPDMDLLVHPTHREGLGMVLLEAQALGIPVVTNAVTGTVDAVEDGVGGRFAELDSVDAWVEAILTLADDAELRRLTGVRGRAFVEGRFDRRRVVPRFADYLDGLRGFDRGEDRK